MNLHLILPILFIINALIHFIQWPLYGLNKKTAPVIAYGGIYLILGSLWLNPLSIGLQWTSFILVGIGLIGLSIQVKDITNARWIDYSIFVLDLIILSFLVDLLILPMVLSLIGQ